MSVSAVSVKIEPSERLKRLTKRSTDLATSGRRNLYADNPEFLVYHWSGHSAAFSPATGEMAVSESQRINIGDHNCRVDVGGPFPFADKIPSKVEGFEYSPLNWAKDYSFFLDHSPAEVYPDETIVGEFHWQLDEARLYKYPDIVYELGEKLRHVGAGGMSLAHTCPDLSIGLELGWPGLLEKIRNSRDRQKSCGAQRRIDYLDAQETVVQAIIRFVIRHADKALELAKQETDPERKARFVRASVNCRILSEGPPETFEQAVQWIYLFQVVERINGHGNGYGRLDLLLNDFYRRDKAAGIITRAEARELVAEMYLKYGGNYFAFAGRLKDGTDATNEVSWIGLEAYDVTGGYNHLGLMWHPDIDKSFYAYGCDVVARHGCGTPTLVNYDILRDSELYSGYSYDDAWNVAYSGCQWYCAVGSEYSDHDMNCLVLTKCLDIAVEQGIANGITGFEQLWELYDRQLEKTIDMLAEFKNKVYEWQDRVWPEMVTSLCMHGPIEKGCDVTSPRGVNNTFTSVNVLGVPNVVDSLQALKELVFEQKRYSLEEVQKAKNNNWQGAEDLRPRLLNAQKFGNDLDEVDEMYVRVANRIVDIMELKRNIKGGHFRPSLFQFMGHTYAGQLLGATYDGRLAGEPFAHGCNPMHGRNTEGITATANSLCKIDFRRFQGGSLQIELQPKFFDGKENIGEFVYNFSTAFMAHGGVQINLNIIDLKKLKAAMEDPLNPVHKGLVVKVTGYSAHFCVMDRKFQEEFIARVNYEAI
jgi:formate C-acetyltransferase